MKEKSSFIIYILLFLCTIILYLPFTFSDNITPDAVDYLNIANNIVSGQGFTISIKWHFFNDYPVIRSAIAERPPLYPLFLSLIFLINKSLFFTLFVNVLLTGTNVLLFYYYTQKLLSNRFVSITSSLVLMLNPNMLMSAIFPLSEQLYILLLLMILIVLTSNITKEKVILVGLLTAFAYLVRPTAVVIILAIIIWLILIKEAKLIPYYLVVTIGILLPWFTAVAIVHHNPFYSVQSFHFIVLSIKDEMAQGYGKEYEPALRFIMHNFGAIIKLIATNFINYTIEFLSISYLGILSVFLVTLSAIKKVNSKNSLSLLVALLNFIFIGIVWATYDSSRFLLITFIPLIPFLIYGLFKYFGNEQSTNWKANKLPIITIIILLFIYLKIDFDMYARYHNNRHRTTTEMKEWVKNNCEITDVICTPDPFSINFIYDRPTIILPIGLDSLSQIYKFIQQYNVKYFVVSEEYLPLFSTLERQGIMRREDTIPDKTLIWFKIIT